MPYSTLQSLILHLYKPFATALAFFGALFRDCCTTRHFYSFLAFALCLASLSVLLKLMLRRGRREGSGGRSGGTASGSTSADTRRAPRAPPSTSSQRKHRPAQGAKQAQQTLPSGHNPTLRSPSLPPTSPSGIQTGGVLPPGALYDTTALHDPPMTETTQIIPSPINRLPPEVLTGVFLHTFPQREDTFADRRDLPPISLRLVCKRWRDIIDGFHTMWRSLNPVLSPFHCADSERGHLLEWYKRVTSEVQVFDDITIHLPEKDPRIDVGLLRYLLKLCPRSSAIKVVLGSHARASPVFDLLAPNPRDDGRRGSSVGPRLDRLRVVEWNMQIPFSRPLPHSLNLPWGSLSALPWGQLTCVRLYVTMSLEDCVFVFEHAKVLEHLALGSVSQDREDVRYPTSPLELSHLRSLDIQSEISLSSLFQMYLMPELRKVKLKLDRDATPHLLGLPWAQLTEVDLRCSWTVEAAEGLFGSLGPVEKFVWKGTLADDEGWSLEKRLDSLKSFTAAPEKSGGFGMGIHLARYILPPLIEDVDIPLIPSMGVSIISRAFSASLRVVTLNQAITPSDFFLFLSCVQNLQKGKFTVQDTPGPTLVSSLPASPSADTHPPTPPTPNYPDTRSLLTSLDLELGLEQTVQTKRFFRSLSLPNVSSLTFEAKKLASSDCDSLVDMLKRDRSPIEKLHLRCRIGDGGVISCLKAVSATVVDFMVYDSDFGSPFGGRIFQALTHGPPPSAMPFECCLCPHLQRLDVSSCDLSDTLKPLEGMIDSRSCFGSTCNSCNGDVKKIQHVKVAGSARDQVGGLAAHWRRKWKEEGIRVELM